MGISTALAGMAAVVGIGALGVQGSATPAVTNLTASRVPSTAPVTGTATRLASSTSAPAASGSSSSAVLPSAPTPAAPTAGAVPATNPASSGGSVTAGSPTACGTTSAPPAGSRCDDGRWRGPDGLNVEGQPDNFDAGDRGAVYLWHGSDGWHLRTTDVTNTPHHYTGTIALSSGARFTSFSTVRLERADRVWVDGDNVLHYDFTTYSAIDGLNFTVSACDAARDHEVMRFAMDYNGHEDDPARIALGDTKQHPDSATFQVTRSV